MMRRIFVLFVLLSSHPRVHAGEGDWAVSRIDPSLLKNANAVCRLEELHFELINTHETIFRNHYVITILNEKGDRWASFAEGYDKLLEILSIDGVLYDANGIELKRLKNKDIRDISGVSEGNLMDDNRVKEHDFYYRVYPYTIEYNVVTRFKNTLFFPDWAPQGADELSVEYSRVTYIFPENYSIRYKAFHYDGEPSVMVNKGKKTMTWWVKGMPAFLREPNQPALHEITTHVAFAPTEFEIENYKGDMSTWEGFGKFVYALKQGRDNLPANVRKKIHELSDGITDPYRKIQVLYEFMQQHTRYVSVQLGIGDWQPFDADYVATKGYGDCKALANFTFSILKEAGIHSFYTLVRAGSSIGRITESFPSQQFNHVILCVPLEKDSVWLECTSETLPAGYLGDFTCDRYALLIDEHGGHLVRTPKYGMKENLEERRIKATLDGEATLRMKTVTSYSGLQQDLYHDLINDLSADKVKEYLHELLDFATYTISKFDYKENKSSLPTIEETLEISVSNYATITGKRLFIIPNVMTRTHRRLAADTARKFDLEMGHGFEDLDSVEIELPEGYTAESLPADVALNTKFGTYNCRVKLKGNKLFYYRDMEFNGGRYLASEYMELAKFYETIYKSDRNKVVLVKSESQ